MFFWFQNTVIICFLLNNSFVRTCPLKYLEYSDSAYGKKGDVKIKRWSKI